MTAIEVARSVAMGVWSPWRQIIVPNCVGMTGEEADLLVLHDSGYMEEVEIKVSKSDFRREFAKKAHKHKALQEGLPRLKHEGGLFRGDFSEPRPHLIRRFWFAMPIDLAMALRSEIPEWAGLIGVVEARSWGHRILKKAPNLKHARKLTDAERLQLVRYGYVRYWDLAHKDPDAFNSTVVGKLEDSSELDDLSPENASTPGFPSEVAI